MKRSYTFFVLALCLLSLSNITVYAGIMSNSVSGFTDGRDYTLEVVSAHGDPSPAAGTHSNYCWHSTVESTSGTDSGYTCIGWSGTGSVPGAGDTNSTGEITLTDLSSSITWNWATAPTVTTTPVSSIISNSASSGGNVTSEGGVSVTARGVCWSNSANPTTADSKTVDGTGAGIFSSSITGLDPGTGYHVRAYATNSAGTVYGDDFIFTSAGPLPAIGGLPDTGQTKCYDNAGEITCPEPGEAFHGQDGSYLVNPPSYTKLNASGNDLSDTATSWVMVRDNVTGLIWEVKTDDWSVHDKDNTYTWYDSDPATNGGDAGTPGDGTDTEDFINALNAEHFGGHTDWRLPTIKELNSISNLGASYPVIDTVYFPHTVSAIYWSSTTYVGSTSNASSVFFGSGGDSRPHKSGSCYVRAVRGGQTGSLDSLVINGDGTVTDASTGLMWQQGGAGTMIWESAISYCEGLSLAGYTDWRLPNPKELFSIVDYNEHAPAIDTTYFPDTKNTQYCSSSTEFSYNARVWHVMFNGGYIGSNSKSAYPYYVRAVRGGQPRLFGHLVISAPAQASTWYAGEVMPITWVTQGITGNVSISISREGGKSDTFDTITDLPSKKQAPE